MSDDKYLEARSLARSIAELIRPGVHHAEMDLDRAAEIVLDRDRRNAEPRQEIILPVIAVPATEVIDGRYCECMSYIELCDSHGVHCAHCGKPKRPEPIKPVQSAPSEEDTLLDELVRIIRELGYRTDPLTLLPETADACRTALRAQLAERTREKDALCAVCEAHALMSCPGPHDCIARAALDGKEPTHADL
jgi:hypothetical protein